MALKGKKTAVFGGSGDFASVSAIAVQNCIAITLLWAEMMRILLLVSKSSTSTSPLSKEGRVFVVHKAL